MNPGTRNGLWYSTGAASSIVATMCIAELATESPQSRIQTDYVIVIVLWIAYFLSAWLFYSLYRCLILKIRDSSAEAITHFIPLSSGLLYGPIFLGISWCIFPKDGDPGHLFWLLFIIPPIIGYELILLAIKLKAK